MFRVKEFPSAVAVIAFTVCVTSAMQTPTAAVAQTGGTVTVTGRVTTRDGKPVPDARVYVPGSNEVTQTDARGNYTLTGVPGGPQVVGRGCVTENPVFSAVHGHDPVPILGKLAGLNENTESKYIHR